MNTEPISARRVFATPPETSELRSATIATPIGELTVVGADGIVTSILLPQRDGSAAPTPVPRGASALAGPLGELDEYFRGHRSEFTMLLAPSGTGFQQLVWAALRAIPYGETRTYGEVAAAVGRPRASRAVGGANNKNPIPIVVPCHRVIGASGALVGYAGGLDQKATLLDLERKNAGV